MKILFIEDNDSWVNEFLPQLQTIADVTHFKGSNAARRSMDETEYDLIVCDHNILRFEAETRIAYGTEIYTELRWSGKETPFIHFSYEPCPELYNTTQDPKFYSLKKQHGSQLLGLIKSIFSQT